VVLVGEGSDELFGGYDIFRQAGSKAPTDLWLFQIYRRYAGRRYGRSFAAFRAVMKRHLRDSGGDRFAAIRLFETRNQLPNNYVMKVDKASMSVSVEARTPFLDQRIAEAAYTYPAGALLDAKTEKKLLRGVARRFNLLPEFALTRPKRGGSMASSWMDDHAAFRSYAESVILAGGTWTAALGLEPAMRDYFRQRRTGYAFPRALSIFRNLAWRLLILELWSTSLGMRVHAH
jgi:asparagine synthase (glutamine-hydrolysing)